MQWQLDFQRTGPGEIQSMVRGITHAKIEIRFQMNTGEQLADKTISLAEGDGQLAAGDGAAYAERSICFRSVPGETATQVHFKLAHLQPASSGLSQKCVWVRRSGAVGNELYRCVTGIIAGRRRRIEDESGGLNDQRAREWQRKAEINLHFPLVRAKAHGAGVEI